MINVDLTKIVHPRAWDFLPAFLPGMWFEISVFLANPEIFRSYVCRANLDHYSTIFIALFGAFILGNAFMFWTILLHRLLARLQRLTSTVWLRFVSHLLQGRGTIMSHFAKSHFLARSHNKAVGKFQAELRGAQRAWKRAARHLLQQRYGIEIPFNPSESQEGEWQAWSGALGTQDSNPPKGIVFLTAVHAIGWSGIAAAYLAPVLRNRFYLAVALFLVGISIFELWQRLEWWNSPLTGWMRALRGVLADFPRPSRVANEKYPANTHSHS